MAIAVGMRLEHFEIVAPLGAGGMGEVYRAKDTRLDREVAIKVLPADFAKDADRLKRFEQEGLTSLQDRSSRPHRLLRPPKPNLPKPQHRKNERNNLRLRRSGRRRPPGRLDFLSLHTHPQSTGREFVSNFFRQLPDS